MIEFFEDFLRWVNDFYGRYRPKVHIVLVIVLLFAIIIVLWYYGYFTVKNSAKNAPVAREQITYSAFQKYLKEGRIKTATFFFRSYKVRGTLEKGSSTKDFEVTVGPALTDSVQFQLLNAFKKTGKPDVRFEPFAPVEESVSRYDFNQNFLLILSVSLMLLGVLLLFNNSVNNSGGRKKEHALTKKIGKEATSAERTITLADVGGCEEAKEDVRDIVEFLKNPQKFLSLGGKMPKGYLFIGPHGNGKTLLAKAVAGEADRPFFYNSASDFVEVYVGVGASRVRNLFEKARAHKPCVIFIDEIDAVGAARSTSVISGGQEERENTLTQLLVEMDGIQLSDGIVLLTATNLPEKLDKAFIRPGRIDRQIVVDIPDVRGRETIFRIHGKNIKIDSSVDFKEMAKLTPNFSGAEIAGMVNEAALIATRKNKSAVQREDFIAARDRIILGAERKILLTPEERKRIAYHEAGHAIVGIFSPDSDPLEKVTIMPRGRALGVTFQVPSDDYHFLKKSRLLAKIRFMMGGREGEKLISEELTSGAADDLSKATEFATRMICELGMSEEIGPVVYSMNQSAFMPGRIEINCSEEMRFQIDKEIKNIIVKIQAESAQIIKERKTELIKLAEALLEYETLNKEEIFSLIKKSA